MSYKYIDLEWLCGMFIHEYMYYFTKCLDNSLEGNKSTFGSNMISNLLTF